jgi:hypothetical protein
MIYILSTTQTAKLRIDVSLESGLLREEVGGEIGFQRTGRLQ